jgi:hypothetical protein
MNPKDLTYQAFKLYESIRRNGCKAVVPSEAWNRLYSLETQAFYRYLRRLKSEDKYNPACSSNNLERTWFGRP